MPRIQTIWQNSKIHHIDRGGVKNTSAESNFTFRACVRNENDNCLRIPFRKMSGKALAARGFEPPWGKRKAPAFVSKAGTSYGIKRYRQVLCANSFTSLAELSLHRSGKPALNYLAAEHSGRVKAQHEESSSPSADGLTQEHSQSIQKAAIRACSCLFRRVNWTEYPSLKQMRVHHRTKQSTSRFLLHILLWCAGQARHGHL